MTKNENKTRHMSLSRPSGKHFDLIVTDIKSLVSLTPFVTDLLMKSGEVIPVDGSFFEILKMINDSDYPVFKSFDGLSPNLNRLFDLDYYRKINYGKEPD